MLAKYRLLPCIIIACAWSSAVRAEDDPVETANKRLAGGTTRDWLAGDVTTFLGSGQECRGNDVYRFSRDHTLRIEGCLEGRRTESKTSWSLAQDGPLDMILTIGVKTYRLTFRTEKKQEHMTLREMSTSKIQSTRDHDFVRSED